MSRVFQRAGRSGWYLGVSVPKSIRKKLGKNITSLKIGGTYNTQTKPQRKTPTHTHQKTMYMRNQLKLQK